MRVKIVTLEYDERLRGFSQEAADRACSGGTLLEVREHFFVHAGSPHLALVMTIDEASVRTPVRGEPDPGRELSPQLQGLYNSLRHWRNEKAKADGVPAYVLFRNTQLAEICRQLPRTMAALQEIEGIGEATARKYGEDLLALMPAEQSAPNPNREQP